MINEPNNSFELVNIVILICLAQLRHSFDFWVCLVGLCFLRIEGVDVGLREHIGQHEILERGNPPRATCLVEAFESFEKIRVCLFVQLKIVRLKIVSRLYIGSRRLKIAGHIRK